MAQYNDVPETIRFQTKDFVVPFDKALRLYMSESFERYFDSSPNHKDGIEVEFISETQKSMTVRARYSRRGTEDWMYTIVMKEDFGAFFYMCKWWY